MTRFQQELSGALGEYWRKDALKEIEKTRKEFESGEITIDADGVARNCIGRALMDDKLEILEHVTDQADKEATRAAREAENAESIRRYQEFRRTHGYSAEERAEMAAAFGEGEQVVDILTGERFCF